MEGGKEHERRREGGAQDVRRREEAARCRGRWPTLCGLTAVSAQVAGREQALGFAVLAIPHGIASITLCHQRSLPPSSRPIRIAS